MDNIQIPANIQEALRYPDRKQVVHEEIMASEKNETWTITKVSPGKKRVSCKLGFSIKHRTDVSIERLKVRPVVRGFTQSYGTADY